MPLLSSRVLPVIPLLFFPAGVALIVQAVAATSAAERLMRLALLLFCPELARMAYVDLKNIATVAAIAKANAESNAKTNAKTNAESNEKTNAETDLASDTSPIREIKDLRLTRFYLAVISTIVLEVTGFYASLFFLSVGAAVIILSQLWFNLFANVQLLPNQTPAIVPFGIGARKAVLVANSLGLGLLCLWPIPSTRIWLSSGLVTLISLFLIVKYGFVERADTNLDP